MSGFKIHTIPNKEMPSYVSLELLLHGKIYQFSFMFIPRVSRADFKLKYQLDQFPPMGSIELMINQLPEELLGKEDRVTHIVTDQSWAPDERYVCSYPGRNYVEALDIAKYWALYNLRMLMTGNVDLDKEIVMAYERGLDQPIKVMQIK